MQYLKYDISKDDLTAFKDQAPAFVTFGEVMIRDTPGDWQRLERTREVHVSLAGSEYTLAIVLSRLGIPSSYITRLPDNPYGWMVRDVAREQGANTDHIVWAHKSEPIGRLLYELGRTPRQNAAWYQRKYSAASRMGKGEVDWKSALKDARLLHTSGISFGLSAHSGYECNYLLEASGEAVAAKPHACMFGLDFNYRASLWSEDRCREVMTPILTEHVDVLITTIEDMARIYGMHCGRHGPEEIDKGDMSLTFEDEDLKAFVHELLQRFKTRIVAVTIRYPDSFEQHRWESAAMDDRGNFVRSPAIQSVTLWDRLGGGDTWNGGFYYGLLTETDTASGIEKGILVGDAATRLKQTLMFDLPIITKAEVQALMRADVTGDGRRVAR